MRAKLCLLGWVAWCAGCTDIHSSEDADTGTLIDSDTHTDSDGNMETETPSDIGTDSEESMGTETEIETETETETQAETETLTEADTASETTTLTDAPDDFRDIPLQRTVTQVKPMTGIVMWNDSEYAESDAIQLEYSYLGYDSVAIAEDPTKWDWSGIESLLDDIASHGHQAVFRFYDTYPGYRTTVPKYIKDMSDYHETTDQSEGLSTDFPDWSSAALKEFMMTFFTELAGRYDRDPRMAFLEVGFGLWAEYHVYDPGEELGVNFPDMAYQEELIRHLDETFSSLCWLISIDAADAENTPFESVAGLKDLLFGVFDDSFLNEDHGGYNKDCFDFFGEEKRMRSPVGGELSYYSDYDQEHALDLPDGPYGTSYEELAATYNVTYMIGADQPEYQSWERIKEAGIASGYNFKVLSFKASDAASVVTVANTGIAPIYYDAYVAVNGVRSADSLMGLGPGETIDTTVASGGKSPVLTIECDRLVEGQVIPFQADL